MELLYNMTNCKTNNITKIILQDNRNIKPIFIFVKKNIKIDLLNYIDELYKVIIKQYNLNKIGKNKSCNEIKENYINNVTNQLYMSLMILGLESSKIILTFNSNITEIMKKKMNEKKYINQQFSSKMLAIQFCRFKNAMNNKKLQELFIMNKSEMIKGKTSSRNLSEIFNKNKKYKKHIEQLVKHYKSDLQNNKFNKKDKPIIDDLNLIVC